MSTTSVILLSFFVSATVALVFPEQYCPEYFTYGIEKNGSYIGVFTANKAGHNLLQFKATFAWKKVSGKQRHIIMHTYKKNNKLSSDLV